MEKLIDFFARQGLFSDLLTVFIFLVGIGSGMIIQREAFPNIAFDVVTITTVYPGASPQEVERLVTNPIEQEMQEVDGIKKLTSVSAEGQSVIVAQLDPDVTTDKEGKDDIQDVTDRVKPDLPEDVEEPVVTSVESKLTPIIELSVAGNMSEMELRSIARELEKEIERISGVARVVIKGLRDIEIKVEPDPRRLQQLHISLDEIVGAIKSQNLSVPGGTLVGTEHTEFREKIVRTVGELENEKDVENTVIRANALGRAIHIKDVAKVRRGLSKAKQLYRTNGAQAMRLVVLKKEKADAITIVDKLRKRIEELGPKYKSRGVELVLINDISYFIRRRLSILTGNLGVGLILVMIVLSLILPFRVALIVSLGIPFAFLGTLAFFHAVGVSLNLISMMGLIIVLGMLVDDAVVVTENSVRKIEDGEEPTQAAINGTKEIWGPVTASVLTTVFAFLPMMFMSGIFGKFVKYIPIGVITALMISLIECFFVLPHHIGMWIRKQKRSARDAKGLQKVLARTEAFWDKSIVPKYSSALEYVLKNRYKAAGAAVALFIASITLAVVAMKVVLFPPEGVEIFFARGEAPVGTKLEQTAKLMGPVEDAIAALPDDEVEDFVLDVGIQQQDPNDPNSRRGSAYAQVVVYLTPEPSRDRKAKEIIAEMRKKVGTPPGLKSLTFQRVNPGPPVGKPISVGVRGREFEEILPAVADIKTFIQSLKGVTDLSDSYTPGKDELQVHVNGAEAKAANLSVLQIGNTVRAAYEGLVASSIRTLDEEIEIRVSLPLTDRSRASTLGNVLIPNTLGNLIPLHRVATIKNTPSIASYQHENNEREVRISGEVDNSIISAREVVAAVQQRLGEIYRKHPKVEVFFGGEDEDTQESLASLFRAFLIAIMGVFLILVATFKRLLQPFLVLITIPLGVIAIIWAFFLHGMPISFFGLLGCVALAGVIVNNAIVLVDFVNRLRAEEGLDRWASIKKAARLRIRPIFLTTVTTVSGILPTAYGLGGLDKFVVPIAMSLGWGMAFGSLMAAFIFPAALAILDDYTTWFGRKYGFPSMVPAQGEANPNT